MNHALFLLNLKALVWTVFVSPGDSVQNMILRVLREGGISSEESDLQDTHLGDGLRIILQRFPQNEDREALAKALSRVHLSQASVISENRLIEVGHYVQAESVPNVPEDCYGVVHYIDEQAIEVIFSPRQGNLLVRRALPFEVMPVYTLTISELDS